MSMLSTINIDDNIAEEKDSLGGGSSVLESALYPMTVALAYMGKSDGGAMSLNLLLKGEDGRDLKQTLWITSGTAKGCKPYYENKDGEKSYLPGFLHADALALLTVGKKINTLDTEEKVINVWSSAARAEVPTKVQMVTELLGQEITVGLIKQTVDKTRKNEATGQYEATGETRDENEIDKLFRTRDGKTTSEIRAQAEEATFIKSWGEKWTGKTKNKAKSAGSNGTAGAPKSPFGAPAAAAATRKPASSLFG